MSRMVVLLVGAWALVGLSANEAAAQNEPLQGLVTAHVGAARGGDVSGSWRSVGGSVAVNEDSGWGAEMDLGYASHKADSHDRSVSTFMINLDWMSPKGLVRPFGVAGAGVMRLNGCLSGCASSDTATDFGMNAGAGLLLRFNDIVGIRGDGRYFWAPGDHPDLLRPDNWGFWRFTVGVTLQWAVVP